MRKHKWRRRIIILVLAMILGMIILSPDRKVNNQVSDAAADLPTGTDMSGVENRAGGAADTAVSSGFPVVAVDNHDEDKKGEETIVGWMIDRIASGEVELSDEGSIRQALDDAERELSVSLTEESKNRIVGFLQTLGSIGVETEDFIDQAKQKYQEYSVEIVEEANEAINEAVESTVSEAAQNFFDSLRQTVKDFFVNLVSG